MKDDKACLTRNKYEMYFCMSEETIYYKAVKLERFLRVFNFTYLGKFSHTKFKVEDKLAPLVTFLKLEFHNTKLEKCEIERQV